MSSDVKAFRASALSVAILLALGLPVQAQDAADKADTSNNTSTDTSTSSDDDLTTEQVLVTGYRSSLAKSINQKKEAKNISDSIFAEDIGKSTDQNIADALSRVTGVSVQTTDGEGTLVSVRGANPDQIKITMNGAELTSTGFNQGVDLSVYSSDVLSAITVNKTPSADHDEGSLGASVSLTTAKPLEVNENIRSFTVQGRYNDLADETNHKISGSFSHKFFDEKLGFILTAYDETMSVRRDQISVGRYESIQFDRAQNEHGDLLTDVHAITPSSVDYTLNLNERNRRGFTTGLQYQPFDKTDINFDYTHSDQEVVDTNHGAFVRLRPDAEPYTEGEEHDKGTLFGGENIPSFTDNADGSWFVVDSQTHTLVKGVNRFADGGFNRRNGGSDTSADVANLKVSQGIGDSLMLELGASYSKSHLEPKGTFNMGLLSSFGMTDLAKASAGPEGEPHTGIQPAGFDCTTGACRFITGDRLVSFHDPLNPWDNSGSSAYNPEDIQAQSVNFLNIVEREVKDEFKSVHFDLDWDIDFWGLNRIEFGSKFSSRVKSVDDQVGSFNNAAKAVSVYQYDNEGNIIGVRTLSSGESLSSISADNYATDGEFPVDNFLQGLGVPKDNVTDGWPLVSAEQLFGLAFNDGNLNYTKDASRTRKAEFDNKAAYLKFNFAYAEKFTGDLGLRYVKTEIDTFGSSGVNYTEDGFGRIFDPFLFAQLRNTSNTACQSVWNSPNEEAIENRWDGLGWDRNGTPDDYSDDVRIPADASGYPCYDQNALKSNANEFWLLTQHTDPSHLRRNKWTDDPSVIRKDDISTFKTSGDHSYNMLLPSLNLSWQIGDEVIARFAASKTMSRPNIDSTQPGFRVNEQFWGEDTRGASVQLNNPKLEPLESRNLDLSFEWYFDDKSMASMALFHKDMSNFEENERAIIYIDDLRYIDSDAGYDSANLVLTESQVKQRLNDESLTDGVGPAACFPKRSNVFELNSDWFTSNNQLDYCARWNASKIRNGKGATISGVELNYVQSYDFLPGIWSGLGSQINYTYQDSKTDKEFSSFDETVELPQFPTTWTPEHAYNATVYWEKNGHQVRLAYRGKSDELVQRTWSQGSLWREGGGVLDFNINYAVADNMLLSFQWNNVLDTETRTYYTSGTQEFADGQVYDEGNPLTDSNVTKSRTQSVYKTGSIYRLSFRFDF